MSGVTQLLVVHHTPSPAMQQMFEAVMSGVRHPEITGVGVLIRPALAATASDVLASDGFLLGTPANIGYMSGALKHFFDQVYYPVLQAKPQAPYGIWVHGASDVTGAVRAVHAIAGALGWRRAHEDVVVTGEVGADDEQACHSLGATLAATLMD